MVDEQWRPVVGYEGFYDVSDRGCVRALHREGFRNGRWGQAYVKFPARLMKLSTSTNGYKYLKLNRPETGAVHHLVHRLVMGAFCGEPKGLQVNHRDGDKANNELANLEYCTCTENLRHCIDVLGKKRGESASSKVTETDIPVIRADARMLREIAADYGVTLQAIHFIKTRRNWAWVA